jgi:hypothetical protein
MIDWCLASILAIFQLFRGLNTFYQLIRREMKFGQLIQVVTKTSLSVICK